MSKETKIENQTGVWYETRLKNYYAGLNRRNQEDQLMVSHEADLNNFLEELKALEPLQAESDMLVKKAV